MSVVGWNATAALVTELPGKTIRQLVTLYSRYDNLNRQNTLFGDAVRERAHSQNSAQQLNAEEMARHTLNAFQSGVDVAISQGKELLRELVPLAGWKETDKERAAIVGFANTALTFLRLRRRQLGESDGSDETV